MESFSINIKLEKANAMKKHRRLQRIASLLRFVEICVVLALVSRFSIQLPVTFKNSSIYFKDLSGILVSPRFVFIIGNVIIITLVMKSGQFSGKNSSGMNPINDIYEEFLKKSERSRVMHPYGSEKREAQSSSVLDVVENRERQINTIQNIPESGEKHNSSVPQAPKNIEKHNSYVKQELEKEETCTSLAIKSYERSLSDKPELNMRNKTGRELRRTMTEKCRGIVDCGNGCVKITYPEDRMSNEEFRCTIESFIERQKRLRRDEENYYYCI